MTDSADQGGVPRAEATRGRIIKIAAQRMAVHGYCQTPLEGILERTGISKGTFYHHFSSKEDLLGAIVGETAQARAGFFARAAQFQGRTRERMQAVGVADALFNALHSDHFKAEQIVRVSSVFDKLEPTRADSIRVFEAQCMTALAGVVEDAIREGDLELPEGMPHCQVLYGLWTMSVGHHTLNATGKVPKMEEGVDLVRALQENYGFLLDGYGWKPLSHEWDYEATRQRILEEVFPHERTRLR